MINQDDRNLFVKNMNEGIAEYIDGNNRLYGKLYVTPMGTFEILKRLEEFSGNYRKTLLRRFQSHRKSLRGWYVIVGDTPLQHEELCTQCDDLDNLLFAENCWLDKVVHNCDAPHDHDTPLKGDSIISYLYKGVPYSVAYGDWMNNRKPHIEETKCQTE